MFFNFDYETAMLLLRVSGIFILGFSCYLSWHCFNYHCGSQMDAIRPYVATGILVGLAAILISFVE